MITQFEDRVDLYERELKSVVTIRQCAEIFEVNPRTVRSHVIMGKLYAEKVDYDDSNPRSGFWIIPFSAAQDKYGAKRA